MPSSPALLSSLRVSTPNSKVLYPVACIATDAELTASLIRRDPESDLCKTVLTTAFITLPVEPTENQLTSVLRAVCVGFVPSRQAECNAFVDNYVGDLVPSVEFDRDTGLACAALGLCQ